MARSDQPPQRNRRLAAALIPVAAGFGLVLLSAADAKALVYVIQGNVTGQFDYTAPNTIQNWTFQYTYQGTTYTFKSGDGISFYTISNERDFRIWQGQFTLSFQTTPALSSTAYPASPITYLGNYCPNQPGNSNQNQSNNNVPCPNNPGAVTIRGTIRPVPSPLSLLALGPLGALLAARKRYAFRPNSQPATPEPARIRQGCAR